jgi:hypothetical protein
MGRTIWEPVFQGVAAPTKKLALNPFKTIYYDYITVVRGTR